MTKDGNGWKWLVACAGSVALWAACTDPVDRAAKARIFSAEEPPKVVASASQSLPVSQMAEDGRVAERILKMGAAEATERIGSFRYHATMKFQWSAPSNLGLSEERTLVAGKGGISGDFRASVDNSRDQGFEVQRAQGRIFARSRYGQLRERKRDRGMAERAREEVFAGLRDLTSLFDGRLKLEPRGSTTHEGRSALRFAVSLASASKAPAASSAALPPPALPKAGADETTQRRLFFLQRRSPQSLSGEIWIDEQTSVVLKASLNGAMDVPAGPDAAKEGHVEVSLESLLTDMGRVPVLAPPEHFLPDADKPPGIAEALERFGIRTRDAGVAPDPEDDAS
jgi:hypothetical protein